MCKFYQSPLFDTCSELVWRMKNRKQIWCFFILMECLFIKRKKIWVICGKKEIQNMIKSESFLKDFFYFLILFSEMTKTGNLPTSTKGMDGWRIEFYSNRQLKAKTVISFETGTTRFLYEIIKILEFISARFIWTGHTNI